MEKGESRGKDMKRYILADSEAGWYMPCDTLDEAAEAADISETNDDCTIQLFEHVYERRYKPAEMHV